MRPTSFFLLLIVAAGLVLSPAVPVVPAAHAQALTFEEVGDRPISAFDLDFDTTGRLWATIGELYRLSEGGVWEEIHDRGYHYLLTLGAADTLLMGGGTTRYSVDGGESFVEVHDDGERLFELASGTLLAGARAAAPETGVLRSTDRGATWDWAVLPVGSWGPDGNAFAEIPAGLPHAGNLVGGFWAGMAYSEDDGATWAHSDVWEDSGHYRGWDVGVGVDGRVYAAYYEQWVEGLQVGVSLDGGATYEEPYYFGEYRGVGVRILTLPGGADPEVGVVLVVEHDGQVSRSDNGGQTWLQVGQVPLADLSHAVLDAEIGPDGRLYASVVRGGANRAWVYRSEGPALSAAVRTEVEAVGVPAGEPVEIGPGGGSFEFRVRLTNETTQPFSFEGWSAAEGPVDREPVVGPQPVTLQPGQSLVRTLTQSVPGRAPAGTYTYTVRAGTFGATVLSEASFEIEKEAGAAPPGAAPQASGSAAWTASGWDDVAEAEAGVPGVVLSVSPNPSRGAATVTLTLPSSGEASVAMYDVLGRRVAVLHGGPLASGQHELPVGASGLPPGVYVVRVTAGDAVATQRLTLVR